ncbi:adenylate/guanylate cyclase domain-containing protein [Muriicola jejuensis]|uniref:adenylate/guanylate cyclase domain-containing protein n=1 Tax=Muriicola jejuensis TaxID=504488 RepID=UPI001EF96B0F|nr:adenylate/guanylate cyclase domain-containing protein [Muriicola jejuensis]
MGKDDISSQFSIPEKLYGRDKEIELLLSAFERVCNGSREIFMVSGYSGIGKSVLVHEILKPVVARNGYFINGKFDQFQRNLPYSAMISAYRLLIQQFLTEGEERLAIWREKFLSAFGPNGQLMIDVIPELELIIGKQSTPIPLSGEAARNRFTIVFRNFIKSLPSQEHPLVVFLDDLQWADMATIDLIHDMMKVAVNSESQYLFLIGAYRDNEVSAAHPLMIMFNRIMEFGVVINNIELAPLSFDDTRNLIADALESEENVESLVKIIYEKTAGNPFFINQFLRELYQEKLLLFNSEEGVWLWNRDHIKQKNYTDNVIDLMSSKILRLGETAKNAVKIASIVGVRYEVAILSNLLGKPKKEIRSDLSEAVEEGLILPILNSVGLISDYKFIHDRVQQAAYSLLVKDESIKLHYKIGKLMLEASKEEIEIKLFDIVTHLNLSHRFLENEEEKNKLAQLNLQAASRAKSSNAYGAAQEYVKAGMSLLPANSWASEYDLTLALHTTGIEISLLNKDFAQLDRLLASVEENSRELKDKVPSLEFKIQALADQSKLIEAISEARSVLSLLGVKLPKKPGNMDIMAGLMSTKWAIGRKKAHEIINLPEMQDPLKLAAMRILISTASSAFLAMPNMFPVIVFNLVKLSLKHGNSKYSTYGYVTYGLILCGALGHMKSGNHFGNIALDIMHRYDATALKAKTYFVYYAFIYQWQFPIRDTFDYFLEGYKSGLETGDFEYGGWSIFHHSTYSFFAGEPLGENVRNLLEMKMQGEKLGIKQVTLLMDIWIPAMNFLIGNSPHENQMIGAEFEDELLPVLKDLNYSTGIFERYLTVGMCNYYFGDYRQAQKCFNEAEPLIESVMGLEYTPQFYYFAALSIIGATEGKRSKKLKGYLKKLKKWSKDCPENYQHKYELVMAENYRVKNKNIKAADYYERAIENAHQNKYLNDEAIANESAAKFYIAQNKNDIALTYVVKARYAYLKWGAMAKVESLDQQYGKLLSLAILTTSDYRNKYYKNDYTPTDKSAGTESTSMDILTVLKASQTISSEIVLENFLIKVMKLITQNAGAEKGFLLLEKDGQYFIEAESYQNTEKIKTLQSIPVEDCGLLAETVVKYVALTKESVILDNASASSKFANDKYIQSGIPKSILCMPFLNHGKTQGIIYLANDLSVGAFTENRLALLRLLTGQIAISIENALFYDQLEQRVKDRTTELQEEKKKSDDLLLNILPADVAEELKELGHFKARNFEQVTVMFTDFVDFTILAETMSPEELVAEIDTFFRGFDEIISKNSMEKIKTIGDAYLCVSGMPENNEKSVESAVQSALEMQEFVRKYNANRSSKDQRSFGLRIGIHTGPLVAGIVGAKKFAYDIWGDTVNVAARMEQNCLPGKINISESTYSLLNNKQTDSTSDQSKTFHFQYRGNLEVKNKGNMKMYFVDSVKE